MTTDIINTPYKDCLEMTDTILYYVRLKNNHYKIGITSGTIENRFITNENY
jgi:hypothetical protein